MTAGSQEGILASSNSDSNSLENYSPQGVADKDSMPILVYLYEFGTAPPVPPSYLYAGWGSILCSFTPKVFPDDLN